MVKNKQELVLNDSKADAERVFELLDVTEATRSDYKSRIGMFLGFVGQTGFNRNSYLSFKRHLADRTDLTVSTKNKYLASARVFLKELNRQGMLPADITQNIKGFSQSKKHKRDGLNEEEITRLSEKMTLLPDNPENTRLKAIICLLALQGLRQIEIARLDVGDIDLVNKKAFVKGKGRDDKEPVDLHPKTVNAIKIYLKNNNIKSRALFQSNSNNSKSKRLTTRGLRIIVKAMLKKSEIEKTIHGFRHHFTTTLIKNYKGNLLEVASYTRHKSLEMLQAYFNQVKKDADLPKYYEAFKGVSF